MKNQQQTQNKIMEMEKFNITKMEKELKAKAKETDTNADGAIFLIINNMRLYNDLIDDYLAGEKVKSYFMYQLNASIFKQLAAFGLVPAKIKATKKSDESKLLDVITKVNKR